MKDKARQIGAKTSQGTDDLLPQVYDELRRLASHHLANEPAGHSLQATALVHEAYLRLVGTSAEVRWNHRTHFFLAAAQAMRRILVDRARARLADKRGGGWREIVLDEEIAGAVEARSDHELIGLHEALEKLGRVRPDLTRLVELRYFAGQTMAEAATSLGVPLRTAERDWTYAKAWLKQTLREAD